ncbi:MAG: SDR family oxidoreductase [Prolixibacteraceae bacterium]|nr:SDR family oxidoreductase [Burkholderiales bacterium]
MNKVLLTGATGFVGSALAANFLARSIPVVVLSRNDPDGERTENAILDAAKGFGLDISKAITQHLDVINVDFSDLEHCISTEVLADVKFAWHCSAEMSYSPSKLASSFEVNVGNSTRLFKLLCAASPRLQRFYYMSTAFVAGMQGGEVTEQLHAGAQLINPYQVSKWGAEHALHLLHRETGMPLTIFRPSIVIGHRESGWTCRNGFGIYMFIDAFRAVGAAGYDHLTADFKASVHPDLISVDQLVEDAVRLTLREQERNPFEVFHCTGGLGISIRELMLLFATASGVGLSFGDPVTSVEQKFSRATKLNMPFANNEWQFERQLLDRALGRAAPPEVLTQHDFSHIITWYLGQDEQEAVAATGSSLSAFAD